MRSVFHVKISTCQAPIFHLFNQADIRGTWFKFRTIFPEQQHAWICIPIRGAISSKCFMNFVYFLLKLKLRTPLSRGSSLCESMGEGCCTQPYPCICKEAVSGFEPMTNKSPRHNFTAASGLALLFSTETKRRKPWMRRCWLRVTCISLWITYDLRILTWWQVLLGFYDYNVWQYKASTAQPIVFGLRFCFLVSQFLLSLPLSTYAFSFQ